MQTPTLAARFFGFPNFNNLRQRFGMGILQRGFLPPSHSIVSLCLCLCHVDCPPSCLIAHQIAASCAWRLRIRVHPGDNLLRLVHPMYCMYPFRLLHVGCQHSTAVARVGRCPEAGVQTIHVVVAAGWGSGLRNLFGRPIASETTMKRASHIATRLRASASHKTLHHSFITKSRFARRR